MDALWPGTCLLLDAHILADRPSWQIGSRVDELDGANLLTLSDAVPSKGFLNSRLEDDFQLQDGTGGDDAPRKLSGHLIRTLIVDAIRRIRPDALWAAQHMLGHATRTMQEVYRSNFAESAAAMRMDERLGEIENSRDVGRKRRDAGLRPAP